MTLMLRARLIAPFAVAGLALGACSQEAPTPEAPKADVAAKAASEAEAPAPQRDIASYVGEYPSSGTKGADAPKDKDAQAAGKAAADSFMGNSKVVAAMFKLALPAAARGAVTSPSTEVPVFKSGNMIVAHGCTPHNCGAKNWTLAVSEDGGKALVCTFEAKEGQTSGTAIWYDGKDPVAKRAEGCPQDASQYSAAQAA